ncbi:hypothetical protein MUK42_00204 [Musa troglodytarum]|uniref:Uncharacterized protein n=1 Tax=Musa troglodytarum TaxID=320322 RepID=A0A9E7FCX0_9LILI|nr:hypothetical protein MUK42_00204 [Musa troglodytarum]
MLPPAGLVAVGGGLPAPDHGGVAGGRRAPVHAAITHVAVAARHHAPTHVVLSHSVVAGGRHVPVHAVLKNGAVAGILHARDHIATAHGAAAGDFHASDHAVSQIGAVAREPVVPFQNSPARTILVVASGPAQGRFCGLHVTTRSRIPRKAPIEALMMNRAANT